MRWWRGEGHFSGRCDSNELGFSVRMDLGFPAPHGSSRYRTHVESRSASRAKSRQEGRAHRQDVYEEVEHVAFAHRRGDIGTVKRPAIAARRDEESPRGELGDEDCKRSSDIRPACPIRCCDTRRVLSQALAKSTGTSDEII